MRERSAKTFVHSPRFVYFGWFYVLSVSLFLAVYFGAVVSLSWDNKAEKNSKREKGRQNVV